MIEQMRSVGKYGESENDMQLQILNRKDIQKSKEYCEEYVIEVKLNK